MKAAPKSLPPNIYFTPQMSLFIVGGFLVCWIPYHSAMIVITFGLAQDKVRELVGIKGGSCFQRHWPQYHRKKGPFPLLQEWAGTGFWLANSG